MSTNQLEDLDFEAHRGRLHIPTWLSAFVLHDALSMEDDVGSKSFVYSCPSVGPRSMYIVRVIQEDSLIWASGIGRHTVCAVAAET